jgi:hypothetical protein
MEKDTAQRKADQMAREVETLTASVEEYEKLLQHLRDDNASLRRQLHDMQLANDALSLKIETEMVWRTGLCPKTLSSPLLVLSSLLSFPVLTSRMSLPTPREGNPTILIEANVAEYTRVVTQSRENKAKADALQAELDPLKAQVSGAHIVAASCFPTRREPALRSCLPTPDDALENSRCRTSSTSSKLRWKSQAGGSKLQCRLKMSWLN